jgi:hypothetical protein
MDEMMMRGRRYESDEREIFSSFLVKFFFSIEGAVF